MKQGVLIVILLMFTARISLAQSNSTLAQYQVTGKVVNKNDKKPIPGVSVFLNSATIGNETDSEGNFTLQSVKPGKYTVIVSAVGFDLYTVNITVTASNLNLPVIELAAQNITLQEVTIKAKRSKGAYTDWAFDTFKKEFLGTSDFAKDCKILNPEVLSIAFDESTNTITASSSDFLLIENDALGYKIKYLLKEFKFVTGAESSKEIHYEGSVAFTPMTGSASQERNWKQARQTLYEGSITNFFRAVLNDQLEENGFRVFRISTLANPDRPPTTTIEAKIKGLEAKENRNPDSLRYWKKRLNLPMLVQQLNPVPLTKADLITNSDQPGLFKFGSNTDPLLVMYNKSRRFTDTRQISDLSNMHFLVNKVGNKEFTLISFQEPYTLFDNNGGMVNPNSLLFNGAWTQSRIADLLPIDYEDDSKTLATITVLKNDTVLKNITTKLNVYTSTRPVEKVYLHLDRSYYMPGDTIWFKAYTVLGSQHQLSALSGVLYTELINNKDSVISRHVLRLGNGLAQANFDLPPLLSPGNYHIRAYTNYMRNGGVPYFYDRKIEIGSRHMPKAVAVAAGKPDVQLFPEGGDLIDKVPTKVAVKSIGTNGLGLDVKGAVIDNDGNIVTTFVTQHLGMGVFSLTPVAGKTYLVNITVPGIPTFGVALPPVLEKAFALAVNNSSADSIYIKVAASDKLFKEKKNTLFYLLAQSGGKSYFTAAAKLSVPVFTTQIAKNRFPSGIIQFTLFSETGQPLNERDVFVKSDDTIKLSLSSAMRTYAPRQKVKIDLDASSATPATAGSFSVSVINESRTPVNGNNESTILNNLLLTSDLEGYIEQPNYYFNNTNAATAGNLDLLMLTQGYHRFEWKKILDTASAPVNYQPETDLNVAGSVTTTSGKPLPGSSITITSPKDNFFTDTVADANGKFVFPGLSLPDTARIILRARNKSGGSNLTIHVNPAVYPTVLDDGVNISAVATSTGLINSLEDYNTRFKRDSTTNSRLLKEVTIRAGVKPKPVLKFSANLNGPGNADQVIMSDQLQNCLKLSDCLNGMVFGIRFRDGKAFNNRNQARLKEAPGGQAIVPPLAIIIDGLVTSGQDGQLDDISPGDVYSIEVLRSGGYSALYGSEAFSGALVITTKRGNEGANIGAKSTPGLITYQFKGYYTVRDFYSPKYDVKPAVYSADLRPTIYWNPSVITGKAGKASFEFFNADTKGIYRVVVEGIDSNGNIGRQIYRYKVE